MTTETISIAPPATPIPVTPAPAVVEAAPVVAQPAPAVVEAPKAPEVTPTVSQPTALSQQPPQTLLGENKPVEAKTDLKNDSGGQSDKPATPPVYSAFTLPEGVSFDSERTTQFTSILGDLELTGKVDHALMQGAGQKLVDFHLNEVQRQVQDLSKQWTTQWEKTKNDWKESFLADPDIGGTKFQATVDSAVNFIKVHGGTPEQQTEFRNLMETSGLGNHPAMIRLLANAGRAYKEGQPLAAQTPVSPAKSKMSTLYGSWASSQ